jgi:hypothetical protein
MSIILGRGQLKIQQMAFMLMAVTLFFVLVALFYFGMKIAGLEKEKVDLEREKAIGLVSKIASTAEFNFDDNALSVDADKLMILKSLGEYRGFWGVKGIIVRKLPLTSSVVECTNLNYPNCNTIKLFTNSNSGLAASYVSLCTKSVFEGRRYDNCELAILMLETE